MIGPDDAKCALLLAVIKIALCDLRRGPRSPYDRSALVYLQALGAVNERDEVDRERLTRWD